MPTPTQESLFDVEGPDILTVDTTLLPGIKRCIRPWRHGSGSASPRGRPLPRRRRGHRSPPESTPWWPRPRARQDAGRLPHGHQPPLPGGCPRPPVTGTGSCTSTPLKALAVDIAENLERPLVRSAPRRGEPGWMRRPSRWCVPGDTTSSERRCSAPRTFVVTTPVALPPRHRGEEPCRARHRRDRHGRRNPHARPRQAGEPPLPHPRAARARVRHASPGTWACPPRRSPSR